MTINNTHFLSIDQKKEILSLWNQEAPNHISHENLGSLEKYLSSLTNAMYTLVTDANGHMPGFFVDFDRQGSRWFAMLLDTSIQGKGIGSGLLSQAKKRCSELNGWVIDHNNDICQSGKSYISPIAFYLKNGFEVIFDTRLESGSLSCVKISWKQ